MSWDVWAEIDTGGDYPARVTRSFNYTHNCNRMLGAVGIDWDELTGKPMAEVCERLKLGIDRLKQHPETFKAWNPPNGWGDYDSLLEVLEEIVHEFGPHPKAVLGTSL